MKKQIISTLLLMSMLATASCGGGTTSGNDTTKPTDSAETTAPADNSPKLELPDVDYNGKTFTILTTVHASYEYDAVEETGDVVNDAVFRRNQTVEDKLGIKFDFIIEPGQWGDRENFNALVKNSVMAADNAFDLVNGVVVIVLPMASDGLFIDANSLEHVNLTNPWWVQGMNDNLAIGGKLYGFIGDASLSLYKDMTVIYFNKRLWDENKAPNPYDLVRNNEWTLDKFITLCSGMQRDLNGDGTYDETDQLTFLGEYVPCGTFQTSLQLDVVRIGNDGTPEYLGLTEKFLSAFEKLQTFHAGEGIMRMSSIDDKSYKSMITFGNGNVATMCNFIYSTEYLRDMKDDYGILPMPKYDENQEKYVSQLGTSTAMLFVPTTTKDIELTSKVMEALSYYTNRLVVPKYYEVALKDKYARDDDIAEMLDIIRDGAAFDFLFVYGTSLQGAPNSYFRFYNTNTSDLASTFASNETNFKTSLEEMIEKYSEIDH